MKNEHRNCKEFLTENSRRFGITETDMGSEYLDICARNVRFIAARRIDERIVLPSMSNFLNSCTGLVDTACGIDTGFASLRITHASEKLVDCDENCAGVRVVIRGQIIARTRSCNSCSPSYMAIPVELVNEVIRDFYSTRTGERVARLKDELPFIDGSCMVINLHCRIRRENCNGSSRFVAHVRGSVVDKLWKQENIWVEGIRPYKCHAVTVCDSFSGDINTDCNDGDCIRFGNSRMNDCNDCDDDCDNCNTNNCRRCDCDDDCGCARNGCNDCCDDDCGNCNTNNCRRCDCDDDCGCTRNTCNDCCDDDCGNCNTNNCRRCDCDDDCGCTRNGCNDCCDDDCYSCNTNNCRRCDCDDDCDDRCGRNRCDCDDDCDDDCDNRRRNGRCRGDGPYVYSGEA